MTQQALAQMKQLLETQFPARRVSLPQGGQAAWREAGDSSSDFAVVLLHGISSGAASWLGVAQGLQSHARVLAWDAPGYGQSSPLPSPAPSVKDYAQRLSQSLNALGVRYCLLVGHSLGALIAAGFARQTDACQVQQLVLISPAGGYGAPAKVEQQAQVRQDRLAALADKGVAGLAAQIDRRLVSPDAPEAVRQWVRWNAAQMHAAGYAQAVELLCGSDLGRAVGVLPMPVQVWVGDGDVVTPPAACAAWAQRLTAPFATLDGAGHASPVEQPVIIAQKLAGLLPCNP